MIRHMAPPPQDRHMPGQRIRTELIRRGWRVCDMAKQIGLSPDYVTNIICGSSCSRQARDKIENLLGIAVWSGAEEFRSRQPNRKDGLSAPANNKSPL